MTNLRKRMLEELQRRNYSPATIRGYLLAVEQFAKHCSKSPDKLGPDELRSYQAYLLTERKLAVGSVVGRVAELRFYFVVPSSGATSGSSCLIRRTRRIGADSRRCSVWTRSPGSSMPQATSHNAPC